MKSSKSVVSNKCKILIALLFSSMIGHSPASAGEVMTDRCSSNVAIVPSYDARPESSGTIILERGAEGVNNWSEPFTVKLGGSGHIRWWCNSTTGNIFDPGTWRPTLDWGKAASCTIGGLSYVFGEGENASKDLTKDCLGAVKKFGSSAFEGWTPERSRCDDRSTTVRARLGPNRLLQIECLGKSNVNTQSQFLRPATTDDIIWQRRDGQVHFWSMDNGQRVKGQNIGQPTAAEWSIKGIGDVDGDRIDDIIWQHRDGQVHFWSIKDGKRVAGHNIYQPVAAEWTVKGVGDVNGDGTDDIIWQRRDGQVHYWAIKNGRRTGGYNISDPGRPEWAIKGVGDVNGDGTDDIIWQRRDGQVHYWAMLNGKRMAGYDIGHPAAAEWTIKGIGHVF